MGLSKKGFMLAEVVVISTLILSVMVYFYGRYVRINGLYQVSSQYSSLDTLYAGYEVENYLIDWLYMVLVLEEVDKDGYLVIDESSKYYSDYLQLLKDNYSILDIGVVSKEYIGSRADEREEDEVFGDYFEYLDSILDEEDGYLLVLRCSANRNFSYAYIEI